VCVCVCVRPSVPKHVRENAEYLRREVFPCCLCLSHLIRNSKSSGSPLGVFPSELFFEFDVTSTPRPAIGIVSRKDSQPVTCLVDMGNSTFAIRSIACCFVCCQLAVIVPSPSALSPWLAPCRVDADDDAS
jgi:hypothetical protein